LSEIRRLGPADLEEYSRIVHQAYPSLGRGSAAAIAEYAGKLESRADRDDRLSYHGLFRGGRLLGGLMLNDFRMNCRGSIVSALGISLVAVGLEHRRSHVCKELMQKVLTDAENRGYALSTLYPFRPDFYRRMGFGFGSPLFELDLAPAQLPDSPLRGNVRLLPPEDAGAALDLYRRLMRTTNGMMDRRVWELTEPLEKGAASLAAYAEDGEVRGCATLRCGRPGRENFLRYDLDVTELLWETPRALEGLLGFLGAQSDQFRRVRLYTHRPRLFHRFPDPSSRNPRLLPRVHHPVALAGVGVMYRFTDPLQALKLVGGPTCAADTPAVRFEIDDDFLWRASRSAVARVAGGRLSCTDEPPEGRISMRIDAFSSMAAGSITLCELVETGMAATDGATGLEELSLALQPRRPPVCLTGF
jgi:predicted acetyltransferase